MAFTSSEGDPMLFEELAARLPGEKWGRGQKKDTCERE
jgi:hypothetical protein